MDFWLDQVRLGSSKSSPMQARCRLSAVWVQSNARLVQGSESSEHLCGFVVGQAGLDQSNGRN